jgi:hypothetical protein
MLILLVPKRVVTKTFCSGDVRSGMETLCYGNVLYGDFFSRKRFVCAPVQYTRELINMYKSQMVQVTTAFIQTAICQNFYKKISWQDLFMKKNKSESFCRQEDQYNILQMCKKKFNFSQRP